MTEINYLQQEDIGGIIAKGLAVLFHEQPKFPIDFLAKWLLQYAKNQKLKELFEEEESQRQQLIVKHQTSQSLMVEENLKLQQLADKEIHNQKEFKQVVITAEYHDELLEKEFCNYLQIIKKLSGVYVCELTLPRKEVALDLDDDELAHIDLNGTRILKYVAASDGQRFLIDRTLQRETGVTYDVLQEQQVDENGTVIPNKGIYVPDVVKVDKMVYHQWPKLGAFYAVPMIYNSVLQEEFFDAGLEQRLVFHKAREDQRKEKEIKELEFEEQIQAKIEAAEDPSQLEIELKTYREGFEELVELPFQFIKREFILCADTLGLDIEISQQDRDYLLEYAALYAKSWEDKERQALSEDIDRQLSYIKNVGSLLKELTEQSQQEEDAYVDANAEKFEELKEKNEKEYAYEIDCLRLEKIKEQLSDRAFIQPLFNLSENRVLKYPSILQAVLYMLHFDKKQINKPGTNVLNWRFAKTHLNASLIQKLVAQSHKGPKHSPPYSWNMINRIQKRLEKQEQEPVENYCLPYGTLLKYVNQVCKLRKIDIEIRRNKISQKRILIQTLQEDVARMIEDKSRQLTVDRELIPPEELELFIQEDWEALWDADHPLPDIPENPEDEIDDDYEFDQQ